MGAGVLGMAIGAVFGGRLADRYGRHRVLCGSTALFGVATLLTAFADTVAALMVCRVIAGLGLGGALTAAIALTSETVAERYRSLAMAAVLSGFAVGVLCAALFARWVIPAHGWRAAFAAGGIVPLLFLPILWKGLVESPFFLNRSLQTGAVSGKSDAADGRPVLRRLLRGPLLFCTPFLWTTYFLQLGVWLAFTLWLPSALVESGIGLKRASTVYALASIMSLVSILPAGWLFGVMNPKALLTLALLGGGLSAMVLGGSIGDFSLMLGAAALCGIFIPSGQVGLNYIASRVYAPDIRGAGVGWAIGFGRLGTIFGATLGGVILERLGGQGLFVVIGTLLLVGMCSSLCIAIPRPDSGRSV